MKIELTSYTESTLYSEDVLAIPFLVRTRLKLLEKL